MTERRQHPLSAAFPRMANDEFQELKDSIETNGVLNPISLLDGMVLDGWHRYSAATELGMDCPAVVLGDGIDPRDFVLAQNKARRNLTASQRANAVTAVFQWRPHGDQRSAVTADRPNEPAVTAEVSKTTKELAAIAGVGTRTIEQAKAVHAGAVQEVQDAVKVGAVTVEVAAAVAKLPAKDQVMLAAKGPDAMRAAIRSEASTRATAQVKQAKAQADVDQNAADAHGDVDPIALLEEAEQQISTLQAELVALQADDQKAETLKFKRLAEIANRRQNELMETVNAREKELQRMSNWLRRIGAAVGEEDHSRAVSKVEAKFRESPALTTV